MKKTPIGHVNCPVCDHKDAEVKTDKNEHAYIHCPDCNAQVFTRNAHRDTNLRKRMRPVTVTVTEPTQQPEAQPAPNTTPKAKAEPGTPGPAQAKPVPAAPTPAPVKKSSWLQPLIGGE